MRILIEVNGGCIQQVYVDPDHVGELELWTDDGDTRENGDDGLMEVGFVVVGSERFDDCLEAARQEDAEMQAEGVPVPVPDGFLYKEV